MVEDINYNIADAGASDLTIPTYLHKFIPCLWVLKTWGRYRDAYSQVLKAGRGISNCTT